METQCTTENQPTGQLLDRLDSNELIKGQRIAEEDLNRYDLSLIEQLDGSFNTFRTYINGNKVVKMQNFGKKSWQIREITRLEDLTTGQIGHLMYLKTKSCGGVTD